jgi:parvulin-like peptidyl-prolyl isomerase
MLRWILRSAMVTLSVAGLAAWAADAPKAPRPGPAGGNAPEAAIAIVGPTRVLRAEFDVRANQAMAEYRRRSGTEVPDELRPVVRRQLLERLIERDLLVLEAKRLNLLPTDQEAEAVVRQDPFFQEGGTFNAAKFQALRNGNPVMFRNALDQARDNLAARRLNQRIEAQSRPDEQAIRARAGRGLGRTSLELFALRRREFAGTFPEPRESEILAYYRAHTGEFQRPDRVVLSILPINQGVSDSLATTPAGMASWERGLRERADSVLRVVQGGTRLEEVARTMPGFRSNVAVEAGKLPPVWRGDDRLVALLYKQQPGTLIPEPVPSNPGWLVVRVDQVERAHVARLSEAAREIRARLREERRLSVETQELREAYDSNRETLRGPGYRVRYAAIDTVLMNPGEPSAQDLDRYYRGHLADYSSFSSSTGTIASQPFEEVRGDVRLRWIRDRRMEQTRALAERLYDSWSRGRRDAATERSATLVRDVGPVPLGAAVDTGLVGRVVGDTLKNREGAEGVGIGRYARGTVVFHVYQVVQGYLPTVEQARDRLQALRAAARNAADESGGRRMYDENPLQFATGNTVHWSQLRIEPPNYLTVTMTRSEVEQHLRQHLDKYSAPELVRVSHILVSPKDGTPAASRSARIRADSLLERIRAGQDFGQLAREYSDDEATRDEGGDLGQFGRGAMLEAFEKTAFSMRPGDVSGVVQTSVGYHILKCHDYLPAQIQPLPLMYSNVSSDLALEKADSLAARVADSLYRVLRTPAQARAAAAKRGTFVESNTHMVGERSPNPDVQALYTEIEKLKPAGFYPGVRHEKGGGWTLAWVDSITLPAAPTWENARVSAIGRYQQGAGMRALEAKRAEMDSMITSGWSVDSLATLWGGLEQVTEARSTTPLPGLGIQDLDSLVFGRGRIPAVLQVGSMSGWIRFPLGFAQLRVTAREAPNPEQLAARIENERRLERERSLRAYYDKLRERYPVRILDAKLRAVAIPTMPPLEVSEP